VQVPAGVSAFPNEILKTSKRWCEAGNYPNIVFWSDHERGGHFPAWEVPELLAADLRAMFRTYR
ncbi:MAG: epoxide hydrolase, partial [Acidimicrobiales bacterium]